jgi:hypothetical protein
MSTACGWRLSRAVLIADKSIPLPARCMAGDGHYICQAGGSLMSMPVPDVSGMLKLAPFIAAGVGLRALLVLRRRWDAERW